MANVMVQGLAGFLFLGLWLTPGASGQLTKLNAAYSAESSWSLATWVAFDAGYFKSTARIYVPQFSGTYAAKDIHVSVEGASTGPYPLLEIAGTVSFQGGRVLVDLAYASDRLKGPLPYNGEYPLKNAYACTAAAG